MTDDEIRQLLREMADEPVPQDSLRRVRAAVAVRTQPRSNIWWRRAALLAAAAIVVVLILWRQQPPIRKSAPRPIAQEQPLAPPATVPMPVRAAAKLRRRLPAQKSSAANEFLIRIETPDPDVVILLIGD